MADEGRSHEVVLGENLRFTDSLQFRWNVVAAETRVITPEEF